MEPNKISVVIVSFNRVERLRESLAALCGADSGLQVIVVDNGSRDGAASLDDEFPGVQSGAQTGLGHCNTSYNCHHFNCSLTSNGS